MKINNETKKQRINVSTNYIGGSQKKKKNSSPSTPPSSPLSSSSPLSPSPSTKSRNIRKINSNLRNVNMHMEIAHENSTDSTLATIADINPFQHHHHNISEIDAEMNILPARLSSTKNTVSNGKKKKFFLIIRISIINIIIN